MNDSCEMWSLPWHALQRNLALQIGASARGYLARRPNAVETRTVAVRAAAVLPANSWMSRAQRRADAA